MMIQELNPKNFGKFQNQRYLFQKGINVVYGENESGKSTLHGFIHSIFFGLQKKRGRASKTDSYNRFLPWNMPAWYEGSIRFSSGEKTFLLERNFKKGEESSRLLCDTDGENLSVEDGDLEMLLGNISETVYENTVSVGQMKSRTDDALILELRNYLSNYQGTGDGTLDVEGAVQLLKKKKKNQQMLEQQLLEKQQKEAEKLQYEMQYIREEIEELKERMDEIKPENPLEKEAVKSRFTLPAAFCAVLLLFLCLSIWKGWVLLGIPSGIMGAGLFIYAWVSGKKKKSLDEKQETTEKQLGMKQRVWMEELHEKRIRYANLKEEQEEQELSFQRKDSAELVGIDLAMDTIRQLSVEMQLSIGEQLKENMSRILNEITGGRYRKVSVDEEFKISLFTDTGCVPLYQVSHGTVEQVYLALRLAVGNILAKEEPLPLVMDEVFSMYDENRLRRSLRFLAKEKEQVILFTCNQREIRILEAEGIPYSLVRLT